MGASHHAELAGEPVEMMGDRALYWPAHRRLLIADLHLGKADVFRRAGIGLPAGGTVHDLQRLSALLLASDAMELWILGDILHGAAPAAAWQQHWDGWRREHAGVRMMGVAGNHDRALASTPLGLELQHDCMEQGPFALRHDPIGHGGLHVICGHLHPLAAVPGMRRRWPAFWLRPGITVLPAFSHFTAGAVVSPEPGEQLIACVDGDAVALPLR